jgi:hypothetical protein
MIHQHKRYEMLVTKPFIHEITIDRLVPPPTASSSLSYVTSEGPHSRRQRRLLIVEDLALLLLISSRPDPLHREPLARGKQCFD